MISLLLEAIKGKFSFVDKWGIPLNDSKTRDALLLLASLDLFVKEINERYPETITENNKSFQEISTKNLSENNKTDY